MAVYSNQDIQSRNPPGGVKVTIPIAEQKDIDYALKTYGEKMMTDVYTYREVAGLPWMTVAEYGGTGIYNPQDVYESYKKWKYIGYSREPVIYVPPWYDVIHLTDEKQLPKEEQLIRMRDRINRLQRSPSPEIARNIATIMTAIDDIQDFCTAAGVGTRLLEQAMKRPSVLSEGIFTAGEVLNSMNVFNKIPWEKLSPGELLDMYRRKKIDLDLLTTSQLRTLERQLKEIHPDWADIPVEQQKQFMRQHYKMTRERWGMSLKDKKRAAEQQYSIGSPWSTIQTEVNKRLARTLPTTGEMLEIAQTSDTLSGIGISFGPLFAFATDLIFGIASGAPLKFPRAAITESEIKELKQIGAYLLNLPLETLNSLNYYGNLMMKTTYAIAAGEDLGVMDFLTSMWTRAQAGIETRMKEFHHAETYIYETIKNWVFGPGAHTTLLIEQALLAEGYSPYRQEGFPGVKLGSYATIEEINNAYREKCTEVLKNYYGRLSKDPHGEFLASCIHAISFDTACAYCEETGVIKDNFLPELMIYTRAVDMGLEPPIYATNEEFERWHKSVLENMYAYGLSGPNPEFLLWLRYQMWPPPPEA